MASSNNYGLTNPTIVGMVMLEEPVDEDNLIENGDNGQLNGESIYNGIYSSHFGASNVNGVGGASNGANHLLSRNISWEYKNVSLTRVPGYGFGIAVSGGSDNPHFANGDPAIAISDVLKGGPAEGKLQVNDRIITANGIKLENVDYGTAVQVLRDSGPTVNLIIKRRIINQNQKLTLNKLTSTKLKNIQPSDYGINLQIRIYVKDSKNCNLNEGDEIITINQMEVAKLFDFKKAFLNENGSGGSKLNVTVVKQNQILNTNLQQQPIYNHQTQPSYESSNGNLYVQPPTRGGKHNHTKSGESLLTLPPPPPPLRPPLPKESDLYGLNQHHGNQHGLRTTPLPLPPPPIPPPNLIPVHPSSSSSQQQSRYINFIKKNQLGIRLSGGNNVGIYISAVQPDTPADQGGLKRGDRILRVNESEYNNTITREEAIEKLSSLKNDSIVSLIVRYAPEFEKILQETEFHDKIYYRAGFELPKIFRKNSIIVVYDSLCNNGSFGWEGYLVDNIRGKPIGDKINLPNLKQARDLFSNASGGKAFSRASFRNKSNDCHVNKDEVLMYDRVIKKKLTWPRPVVIYSNFTELINERLCREFPQRFAIVKSTLIEEVHTELRVLMEKGLHGLLQIKSVASFDKLINTVCPIAIVVKTEDKHVFRDILRQTGGGNNNNKNNNSANYYTTLLRSFNKSSNSSLSNSNTSGSMYKKQSEELQKTEDDLGEMCRIVNLTQPDNWFRNIIDVLEQELKVDSIWIKSELNSNGNANLTNGIDQHVHEPKKQDQNLHQLSNGTGESSHGVMPPPINSSSVVPPPGESKLEVPNYNVPPPYAVQNGNGLGNSSFVSLTNHQPHLLPQNGHQNYQLSSDSFYNQSRPSIRQNSSSPAIQKKRHSQHRPYSTESLNYPNTNSLKRPETTPLLAHSPVLELQPIIQSVIPAPQIDRTKKPQVYQSVKQKPIPPPKPVKLPTKLVKDSNFELEEDKQSYYLNLPINSKSFPNNNSPSKSAFELYRKPNVNLQSNYLNGALHLNGQLQQQQFHRSPDYMQLSAPHQSEEDNVTTGTFDCKGGTLLQRNIPSNQIPIELRIPEGAIAEGHVQTIWFHAVQSDTQHHNNQLDLINGNLPNGSSNYLISPLIKFGPEGLRFNKPVEIRIPQYSKQSNASVLLGSEKNANSWSKINIQPDNQQDDTPFKIVSLTIQQF